MLYRFISGTIKILLISFLVGLALSSLNITAAQILQDFGLTPEEIVDYARRGMRWALPYIILGALVTLPVWLVMYLLRPPRGD